MCLFVEYLQQLYLTLFTDQRGLLLSDEWAQLGTDISDAPDQVGKSVSLSDDGLVVAIAAIDLVHVLQWNGTEWTAKGKGIAETGAVTFLGEPISLSGNGDVIAIGNANAGDFFNGRVRVHAWNGTDWIQRGSEFGRGDLFQYLGTSVSLSSDGSILGIGSIENSDNGFVSIYEWSGSIWTQKGADIIGEASGDDFGTSQALTSTGNAVAIGAHKNSHVGLNSGHVRVYEWNGSEWAQKGADC